MDFGLFLLIWYVSSARLEYRTVTAKVTGSNPVHTAKFYFMENPQKVMSVILTILFTVFALVEAIFNGSMV